MKVLKNSKAYGALEYTLLIPLVILIAIFIFKQVQGKGRSNTALDSALNKAEELVRGPGGPGGGAETGQNRIIAAANQTSVIFLEDLETANTKVDSFIQNNVTAVDKNGQDITDQLVIEKNINTNRLEDDFVTLKVLDQTAFIKVIKTVNYANLNPNITELKPSTLTIDSPSNEDFNNKNIRIVFRKNVDNTVTLEIFDRNNYEKVYLADIRDLEGFNLSRTAEVINLDIAGIHREILNTSEFKKIALQAHMENLDYNLEQSLDGDITGLRGLLSSFKYVFKTENKQSSVTTLISINTSFNYLIEQFLELEEISSNNSFMFIAEFITEESPEWQETVVNTLDLSRDGEAAFTSKLEIVKTCLDSNCSNTARLTSTSDIGTKDFTGQGQNQEIDDFLWNNDVKHLEVINVKKIGDYTFDNLFLKSVNLTNVETIGESVFFGNELTALNLDNNLKEIGMTAFASNKITEINFTEPYAAQVKLMGRVFDRNNLQTINLLSNFQSWGSHNFSSQKVLVDTVIVNRDTIGNYELASTNFRKLIINNSSFYEITNEDFSKNMNMSNLEEIIIKKEVCPANSNKYIDFGDNDDPSKFRVNYKCSSNPNEDTVLRKDVNSNFVVINP